MEASLIFWFDWRIKFEIIKKNGLTLFPLGNCPKYYFSKSSFDKSQIEEFKAVISGKNLE